METKRNLNKLEVLKLVKTFPLNPLFNGLYITSNKLEEDGNFVLSDNILSDVQYVVAAGSHSTLKAGDKVIVDLEKLMVPFKTETNNVYETEMRLKLDLIEIEDNIFALINDRVIKAIDNRE